MITQGGNMGKLTKNRNMKFLSILHSSKNSLHNRRQTPYAPAAPAKEVKTIYGSNKKLVYNLEKMGSSRTCKQHIIITI